MDSGSCFVKSSKVTALVLALSLSFPAFSQEATPVAVSTDEKFEQVAKKFETVDAEIDELRTLLKKEIDARKSDRAAIDNRIAQLEDKMLNEFTSLNTSLDVVNAKVAELSKGSATKEQVKEEVAKLVTRVNDLDEWLKKNKDEGFLKKLVKDGLDILTMVKKAVAIIVALV